MEFSGDPEAGLETYTVHCENCHGLDGEGASALSLNHPEFLRVASDGFLWHAITYGRSGTTMAAYENSLTEDEVTNLIALIRSWEPL